MVDKVCSFLLIGGLAEQVFHQESFVAGRSDLSDEDNIVGVDGILRAVGASKRDVSRVFNAETLIVGFASGAIGILVTLILSIPINIVIKAITDISGIANLPWVGAIALILISMVLTYVAGLIPARVAAKKDPVIALRSE